MELINARTWPTTLNLICIFLLNDFWMLKNYKNALADYQSGGGRIVAYAPLDGIIEDENILYELDYLDIVVVYNYFSKEQIEKAIQRIRLKDPSYTFPPGKSYRSWYR